MSPGFIFRRRPVSRPANGDRACARLAGEGTDILDIGAESTRPYGGTVRVPLEEERARLAPSWPR